jgi:hypothetical protein
MRRAALAKAAPNRKCITEEFHLTLSAENEQPETALAAAMRVAMARKAVRP